MKSEVKLFTGANLVEITAKVNKYADERNISIETLSIDTHGCRACMLVSFDTDHRCSKALECVTAFDEATFNGNLEIAMEHITAASSVYNPIVEVYTVCSEIRYTGVILYQGI